MFSCSECGAFCEKKTDLDMHLAFKHNIFPGKQCKVCGENINEKNLRRHELSCGKQYNCKKCGGKFRNEHSGLRHEQACREVLPKMFKREPSKKQLLARVPDDKCLVEYESAFGARLKSYFILCEDCSDLISFLTKCKERIVSTINQQLHQHGAIKFNILVECRFVNAIGDMTDRAFKTANVIIYKDNDLDKVLFNKFKKLVIEMEESMMKKSGWSLHYIDGLRLRINKYNPLRGSSFIPLPPFISKKACINVENYDGKCFMYSILAKFVLKHPQRVAKYKNLLDKYDFSCVTFPTPLDEIKKFEKHNNISINVFGVDEKRNIYPIKVADNELSDHRDLILLENEDKKHYVYVKNFERLIRSQITKHKDKIVVCKRCFTHFDSQYEKKAHEKLIEHKVFCNKNAPVRVLLPNDKPYVEFEHVEKAIRVPYVVYCDFESVLRPIDTCQPDPDKKYSQNYQLHEPMSFCCYLKISDDVAHLTTNLPTEPYLYRGEDASQHLMEYLKKLGKEVSKIYDINVPMRTLTLQEENNFQSAKKCYMCDKDFKENDTKVRDHDHLTGNFRGAAHSKCNLRYQAPKFLPILFHNLTGYDAHYIVRQLGYDDMRISVIPNSEEKYISFSKSVAKNLELRFLDTFRFMPSSLESLVRNLPELREISKFFSSEHLPLLIRKGVFPYDYVTKWSVLKEQGLPDKSAFYNKLNNSNISDEDYAHAQKVWNTFEFKNLGEYSDHYLKTDVLLLADVFETFRDVTLKTHKLDPCNYFTLPGLSWDAMLRFTGVRLQLLTDYNMILMIERGIRGGICQVSHRYMKANNKYMTNYNPDEDTSFITYQDCNNLYGYAMVQALPYGGFEWTEEEIDLEKLTPRDRYGYILDVDLEYPQNIHDLHNALPFLPENIEINKQVKLIPHLQNRDRYIVHYLALKQALEHGVVLKKINRALRFHQSEWLKPYIEHNTKLRTLASTGFEKDLYKLYNNSVFGKTMENVRNRLNMQLVCNTKKMEKMIARCDFIDRTIYGENLAAVHLMKNKLKFNKPLYIGLSVLDLSKIVMYKYHYDVMLPKYGPERLILAYTDTDAFIYHVFTEDIYEDFRKMMDYLDTSDYPMDHPCYSDKNKKVLGKFKDEANSQIIHAFVGLRAKMYSLIIDQREIKKAKGVKKAVLKKAIRFDDYVTCLKQEETKRHPMNFIRSTQHIITSMEINKISLSSDDDKRVVLEDGISTLAIGHYKTL